MEVKIDHDQLQTAIAESLQRSVDSAVGSFDMSRMIRERLTSQVAEGAIADAMDQAIAKIDTDALTNTLAAEIQRATTSAVVYLIQEAMTTVILQISGKSLYGEEERKERERVKALIRKSA